MKKAQIERSVKELGNKRPMQVKGLKTAFPISKQIIKPTKKGWRDS